MRANVYGVSDRLKAFISFFSISLIVALIGLFIIPFIAAPPNSFVAKLYNTCCSTEYLFYLTPLFITAAIILGMALIIAVFSKKIIFTSDSIISKNAFVSRKITFDEVRGFTVDGFILYIETKNEKRMTINLLSLNRADNLIQILEKRFVNLDFKN